MHQFKELSVWQKAMKLTTDVCAATKDFPDAEKFGLTSQIRRSAVSIGSKIAEGSGRKSKKEFKHFLIIAFGSGSELESQLLIAKNPGFMKNEDYEVSPANITKIQKRIYSLSNSLK